MSRVQTLRAAPAPRDPEEYDFGRLQRAALIAGVVGVVLLVLGFFVSTADQFYRSYHWAFLYWLGLAMGCFGLTMLQHLVGGRWGAVIRRLTEAGTLTLPLMAILFLPLIFGIENLFEWSHQDVVAEDPILQHKQPYLNVGFFLIRAALYFVIWIGMAFLLNRWSVEQDRTGDPRLPRRFRLISAPGLIIYMLTMTFASFDWAMSLEPHWYSTMYGALFVIGQALTTLAFITMIAALLSTRRPMAGVVRANHFHDLGNLMLAFTMLWAYMSFSQFLIIWSGNLPEEVTWYINRSTGTWRWVPPFLIIFHFALPFALLLLRQTKRRPQVLGRLAIYIMVVHVVNMFWLTRPAFHPEGFHFHWLDLAAPIGIGGLWIAAFLWLLQRKPLIAPNDHRWHEEGGHE